MRSVVLTVLLCLCATAGFATAASDQFTLPAAGFSIAPLEGAQALLMVLPPSGGFAANVNVQVQPYGGTREEYIALSRGELQQLGATVLVEFKEGESDWVIEYAAEMSGHPLHFYSRAKMGKGKVFLATATASKDQWPSLSSKLKACVDSLKVTQ